MITNNMFLHFNMLELKVKHMSKDPPQRPGKVEEQEVPAGQAEQLRPAGVGVCWRLRRCLINDLPCRYILALMKLPLGP